MYGAAVIERPDFPNEKKLVYILLLLFLLQFPKYYPAKATNVVMNYTETEAKVREATNDDPWGPSGFDLNKIINQFHLKLEFGFFYNTVGWPIFIV